MASKTSPVHPPIGTLIDGDSLMLEEVLGVGGYGVVYRAVDVRYPSKQYAVKCLVASGHQIARQRQIHIREIALHQLASAHPGVVTLHRVVEQYNCTYIIMDYAPDHDLFTQILHNCRYLGNDALIKDVFLQMLDAVEYCHSLGIYHRDLKPENILCFDDGLRVAITDFGLATTDKISDEFRTGSVYHMSPECQGGAFAPGGKYSPMFNDIWSLGIILLNLATGRNPWKSATADDPTFQAYLRDPYGFLPTVLPISPELNDILVQMLDVDWRRRMKLTDIRYAIEELTSFYSDGVVFEGSMARCPWEAGMDIDSESSEEDPEVKSPQTSLPISPVREEPHTSAWSRDSASELPIEDKYPAPWPEYSSAGATWAYESPVSSNSSGGDNFPLDRCDTPSEASTESPTPSLPPTPNSFDVTFSGQQPKLNLHPGFAGLTINTNLSQPRIFRANESMDRNFSTDSDIMHTAIEYDPYSSLFFMSSPLSAKIAPDSALTAVGEDKEMTSPSAWRRSYLEMSSPSAYSRSSSRSSFNDDVRTPAQERFTRSATPSPEPHWSSTGGSAGHHFAQVESHPSPQCQPSPASAYSTITDTTLSLPSRPAPVKVAPSSNRRLTRRSVPITTLLDTSLRVASPQAQQPPSPATPTNRFSGFSVHRRLFNFHLHPHQPEPCAAPPASAPAASSAQVSAPPRGRAIITQPYSTFGRRKTVASKAGQGGCSGGSAEGLDDAGSSSSTLGGFAGSRTSFGSGGSSTSGGVVERVTERRRVVGRRSATRHWFMPGKLFAAVGAS